MIKTKTVANMMKVEVVSFDGPFLKLHLQYEVKDENSKRLIDIPMLETPIYTKCLSIAQRDDDEGLFPTKCHHKPSYIMLLDSDEARLCKNEDDIVMTDRIVETYPHEMTIEEIEKALGYSVKIVKEKKND